MRHERNILALYVAHRSELVNYANGIVRDHARAEDVVQEAWERVSVVASHRHLSEPLRYFYRVVRNLALDGQRAKTRDMLRDGGRLSDVAETVADDAPTPEAETALREELRIVLDGMNELPARTRRALTLHTMEGLKLREVAARLGLSVSYTQQLVAEGKLHCIRRLARGRKGV